MFVLTKRIEDDMMRAAIEGELLYDLFETTRGWTPALRRGLACDDAAQRSLMANIAGEIAAEKMGHYFIFAPGEPAPLNRAELSAVFAKAIAGWPAALCASLIAAQEDVRRDARWGAARLMAADLSTYQVVIDPCEPPRFGTGDARSLAAKPASAGAAHVASPSQD